MNDYYKEQSRIYELLRRVINNIQIIKVIDVSEDKLTPFPRMEETDFVVSDSLQRRNKATVTAHYIEEYRPSKLKLEKLMRQSDKSILDILLEDIGGIRGVPIQST